MIRIIIWTLLYWFAAALVLVGIIFMFGDCGTEPNESLVQQCAEGQHQAFWIVAAMAACFYVFLLWRRYGKRQSQ
jgi:hypothetical protein